jgi:hypothetical protein
MAVREYAPAVLVRATICIETATNARSCYFYYTLAYGNKFGQLWAYHFPFTSKRWNRRGGLGGFPNGKVGFAAIIRMPPPTFSTVANKEKSSGYS